jgi:hypothetical protein
MSVIACLQQSCGARDLDSGLDALTGGLFLLKQVKSLIAVSLASTFFCGHGQTWHFRLSLGVPAFLRLCDPSLHEPRALEIFLLVKTSV